MCVVALMKIIKLTTECIMTGHVLNILEVLKSDKWVELTHTFSEDAPYLLMFQSNNPETIMNNNDRFYIKNCSGKLTNQISHLTQNTQDLDQFVLPLVVIDQSERAKRDPQFSISKVDILNFELKHGQIPEGSFVALRTDWSKRWPSQTQMENKNILGKNQTPGWALDALKFLFEERKIKAIGQETFDTDASKDIVKYKKMRSENYVLSQDAYQIKLMTNLDLLPTQGAVILNIAENPENIFGCLVKSFAILP